MVRIVAGESWKINPDYQSGLREITARAARRFSPSSILDVVGIEVDGVNLSAGLGETALFDAVEHLAAAVARLVREPGASAQVSLGDDHADLVLGRRGTRAILSVVSMARPARLIAGEVEVELNDLAVAVAECASGLLADLEDISPAAGASPFARRLRASVETLTRAARLAARHPTGGGMARPLEPVPVRPPDAGAPAVGFELRDAESRLDRYRQGADLFSVLCPGRVFLRGPDGSELPLADAPPFLVLTEAARAARELLGAIDAGDETWTAQLGPGRSLALDLRAGQLRFGRATLPCRPVAFARSLLAAVLDFCGAVTARNPAQASNPYVAELADTARERLAHARELEAGDVFADGAATLPAPRPPAPEEPLGHGNLKRLRYRAAWQAVDLGERARTLLLEHGALVALGRTTASFLEARSGRVAATYVGESAHPADAGVLAADRGRLQRIDLDGRTAFRRESAGRDQPALTGTAGACLAGPRGQPATVAVFDRHLVTAVYTATGRVAWQFTPPQAVKVSAGTLGDRVFVSADNGFLYALDAASGHVVFRVRSGYAFQGQLLVSRRAVASLGRRDGAMWLAAVDPSSGRPHMARPVGLQSAGAPVISGTRLFVGGVAEGNSAVAGFDLRGRELFRASLGPNGGTPKLAVRRGRVYCGTRDGAAACLAADGRVLWKAEPRGVELDQALAPVVRRGVAIVAGDPVRGLDADTGALLCELPPQQGLSALAVGRGLEVYLVDEDGVAACFRLATHLSVVG